MLPTIDVLNLQREELVWVDNTSVAWTTFVGKIAGWLTPVTTRTGEEAWHIFAYDENTGQMTRPIDPETWLYFDSTPQVRDLRTSYTYW